jgi:hypothetical protein
MQWLSLLSVAAHASILPWLVKWNSFSAATCFNMRRLWLCLQELLTRRTWDVARHAQWLVFEVEGRLQIRPAQHTLARTLLDGSLPDGLAPIAQLNMGEGKTRVILPMMALELADGGHLVRESGMCYLEISPHRP